MYYPFLHSPFTQGLQDAAALLSPSLTQPVSSQCSFDSRSWQLFSFFSDGYTTEEGEELSVREIKQLLKECIEHENKENPYNDDELADILREKAIRLPDGQ